MKRLLAVVLMAVPVLSRAAEEGVSPDAPPMSDGETLAEKPPSSIEGERFSGDLRLRTQGGSPRPSSFSSAPPSLRHSPYAYQRLRTRWGDRVEAGAMALRPVPGPSLSAGDLRRNGVVKGYVSLPGSAVAGDYSLSFGQGLLFYDRLGEFVRPAWVQGRGPKPDLSGVPDESLRGGVARLERTGWSAVAFFSRQALDLPLNPDGTAAQDLWSLREGSSLQDEGDLSARNTTEEKMGGARFQIGGESLRFAATAAQSRYAPALRPPASPFNDASLFRGRGHALRGADAAARWGDWRLAADAALSVDDRRRGKAWAWTLYHDDREARLWVSFFDYDAGYFSRLGKGPSFEVSDLPAALPANQRGLTAGARRETLGGALEGEAAWAHFPSALGDGQNQDPVFPSQARRWRLEGAARPAPEWELSARIQERVRDLYALPAGAASRRQGEETVRRARLQSAWYASPSLRLTGRYDVRWERTPFLGDRAEGKLLMGEVRWSGGAPWSLAARWYAFQSPRAFLTTGVEEIWDGVVAPRLSGGMGNLRGASGERYAVILRRRWGKRFRLWAKYDANRRWRGADLGDARHGWRLQTDMAW